MKHTQYSLIFLSNFMASLPLSSSLSLGYCQLVRTHHTKEVTELSLQSVHSSRQNNKEFRSEIDLEDIRYTSSQERVVKKARLLGRLDSDSHFLVWKTLVWNTAFGSTFLGKRKIDFPAIYKRVIIRSEDS